MNTSLEEIIHYSPKMIDVINLEKGVFETVDIQQVLKEYGNEIPGVKSLVSVLSEDQAQIPSGLGPDFERDNFIVTFDGLFSNSQLLSLLRTLMHELQDKLQHPVDIEFACDGDDFYLHTAHYRQACFGDD